MFPNDVENNQHYLLSPVEDLAKEPPTAPVFVAGGERMKSHTLFKNQGIRDVSLYDIPSIRISEW
jgi:hypothetical protein